MARHFMHNGPVPDSDEAVMISRWQSTVRTVKAPRATLAALSWAADKAGMSYGRFLQTLGPSDEARIQEQYETFIAQREREMAKRCYAACGGPQGSVKKLEEEDMYQVYCMADH